MAEFPLYHLANKPYNDYSQLLPGHHNCNDACEETNLSHCFLRRDSSISSSALSSLVELDELVCPQTSWESSGTILNTQLALDYHNPTSPQDQSTYSPTDQTSSPHLTDWQSLKSQNTSPISPTHARPIFVKSYSASVIPSTARVDDCQSTSPLVCSDDEFHISRVFPSSIEPQSPTTDFHLNNLSPSNLSPRNFSFCHPENSSTGYLPPRTLNRSPSWPSVTHPLVYHNTSDQTGCMKIKKKTGCYAAKVLGKSQFIPSRNGLNATGLQLQCSQGQKSQYMASAPVIPSSSLGHLVSSSHDTCPPVPSLKPPLASSQKLSISSKSIHALLDCPLISIKSSLHNAKSPIRPNIQSYLSDLLCSSPDEFQIIIQASRVVQKSYGTEKRLLCPPPIVNLPGKNWAYPLSKPTVFACMGEHIEGGEIQQAGDLEYFTQNGVKLQNQEEAQVYNIRASFRNLYLSEQFRKGEENKKKTTSVKITTETRVGKMRFEVPSISIVSKPPQKRNGTRNIEGCLFDGSTVAFYNRLKGQYSNTRFLGVSTEENCTLTALPSVWDQFFIFHAENTTSVMLKPLPILYNQSVILQCKRTGNVSPAMIIRKMSSESKQVNEPVTSLQKIALELAEGGLLCCMANNVGVREHKSTGLSPVPLVPTKNLEYSSPSHVNVMAEVPETAIWTIVATIERAYTLYVPSATVISEPLDMPYVTDITFIEGYFIVHGNYLKGVSVWLGDDAIQYETSACGSKIQCLYPPSIIARPLILVRSDGIILQTGRRI